MLGKWKPALVSLSCLISLKVSHKQEILLSGKGICNQWPQFSSYQKPIFWKLCLRKNIDELQDSSLVEKKKSEQYRKSFWQQRNPWLGYNISHEHINTEKEAHEVPCLIQKPLRGRNRHSQPHSLPCSISWYPGSRFLVRICWRRRRIFCFSSWISLSLSSSPSSSSRHWLIMLHFISSMAAIKDSDMLKWAFSWGRRVPTRGHLSDWSLPRRALLSFETPRGNAHCHWKESWWPENLLQVLFALASDHAQPSCPTFHIKIWQRS